MTRDITKIIIHCSATPPRMDIGAGTIKRWHTDPKPKGRGWSDIGYHWVIRRDGRVEQGRPEARAGAHVRGHNANSIGICLVGGTGEDGKPETNFTKEQWASLRGVVSGALVRYPGATVHGHNEFANKACPTFNASEWWAN